MFNFLIYFLDLFFCLPNKKTYQLPTAHHALLEQESITQSLPASPIQALRVQDRILRITVSVINH